MYSFARLIFILILGNGLLLAGCSFNSDKSIVIFAPSSMMNALNEVSASSGSTFDDVLISYGGSGFLANQIVRGAKPDIFIAAGSDPIIVLDRNQTNYQSSRFNLMSNRLAIVGKKNQYKISDHSSLNNKTIRRIAVTDPRFAPSGLYAEQFFDYYQLQPFLKDRLIYGMNVRDTLQYVLSGNADVGIVYKTDVINADLELLYLIPEESHLPIRYPVSILDTSSKKYSVKKLIEVFKSRQSSKIFSKYGFIVSEDFN